MKTKFSAALRGWQTYDRDPRYIVNFLWAIPIFTLMYIQAVNQGWFDGIEKPIFHWINNWPHWIGPIMYLITQLGSLGGLIVWTATAWYLINRRAAVTIIVAGTFGWLLAKVAKTAVHRGRPQEFIHQVNLFHQHIYSGYGFPSGHSTFSAACATVLYFQVRPRYRKYLILTVLLVGLSRIYLGAHFPLDVVGGWMLGIICGSAAALLMGSSKKFITSAVLKRAVKRKGYEVKSLRFASVDARGSQPVFIELTDGTKLFGKVFGEREHAADWLFKLYRFFRYKNLQAEEPYLNGRRNIELESFANLWAQKSGVRAVKIIDIIKVGRNWLLMQQQLQAKPLSDLKRIKTTTLEDAWKQVMKLHDGNLAHRDLRAANLMVDTAGNVWIIDYGFAEVSPNQRRKSMDIAELLMSMSLVAGVERTMESALKIVGSERLTKAAPYVHRSVFSGATNQLLRSNKSLLRDLQSQLHHRLALSGDVEAPDIERVTKRKLIIFAAFAVFAYVIIPQFSKFKQSLESLENVSIGWLLPLGIASILTYVAAAAVYIVLATVPLKLREGTLVQLAASFMSKIVPGGIGATGLNIRYLTKSGLDKSEASALVVAQSAIGFITFIVPLLLILLVSNQSLSSVFKFHIEARIILLILLLIIIAAVTIGIIKKLRQTVIKFALQFISQLRDITTSPRELALASAASLAISTAYVACLYCALHAVHASLGVTTVIVVYAGAMIAKSAVPTPGGLGPVEIAMSAALLSAGVPAGAAFAAVILYRLATFWLPVPFSVLAYRSIVAKKIV